MKSTSCVVVVTLLALLLGCDRNIGPFDPDEEPKEPDLSRIFPAPTEADGDSTAGAGPAGAGGEAVLAASTGRSGAAIRGTVHAEGEAPLGPGAAVFVIARPAGAVGGPPLAVVRVPQPSFPLDFEIGPGNVMIPTMKFEGALELTARLDADGNASTRGADDRETPAPVAASPGDVGVVLQLE